MFKKLLSLLAALIFTTSSGVLNAVTYEIQDVDTLQTVASHAIAINTRGRILGWYNVDGTPQNKRYFVRDLNGNMVEIASESNLSIKWKVS